MKNPQAVRTCPRCAAHALVWSCKLLTGNKLRPLTWVCPHCESVFDRHDLRRFFAAVQREKSPMQEKISWV